MKVVVLATSYPRDPDDVAGAFVRDGVERLRERGIDVAVVSPATFRHYGIAYGAGIPANLRARPWRLFLLPLFFLSYARAARRASREADVVHAHWLPSAIAGAATRRPLVVQLWGTDAELARKLPWLARRLLRRARVVVCASGALAEDARALGARDVRVVPAAVGVPEDVAAPDEPPHVLYVGRLAEEKGVRELARAARGLRLVVVGDGPLRSEVPEALGFVPPPELGRFYERASIVVVPSLREGYGMAAREAMAYGRPVVGSAVGGLVDAIDDGVTGFLVPPGDVDALRGALERMLGDPALRARLGAAGRTYVQAALSPAAEHQALVEAYSAAIGVA